MKKRIAALVLFAGMAQAQAADVGYPQYAPPPPPVVIYRWTGPYIGANLGYQWGSTTNNPTQPSGIAGGVQAGFNWQNGNFVFGGETDINLSGADDVFAPWKFSNPWWGTLRGRAGVAWQSFLFYGTGGLAYGHVKYSYSNTNAPFGGTVNIAVSDSHIQTGWTAGGGVEYGWNN